jgi:NAD(P)-dependent dehydrogenase (short-subunit alcohol dehydrogenase family)
MNRMEGKVACITGAASGIGRASAEIFLRHGAHVVIADIDEARGAALMREWSGRAHFVRVDVRREDEIANAIGTALSEFGRLDCMFNNAGMPGRRGSIADTDAARLDDEMAVLFRSVLFGMKHAAPVMIAQRSGAIISTSSVAGLRTGWGSHVYSAAKAAIVQLTRTVAAELGEHNVRVNCICPGGIATPLLGKGMGLDADAAEAIVDDLKERLATWQPIPRAGLAEDVAHAALYLACDEAGFVNGHALVVDGGLTGGRGWSETLAARNRRITEMTGQG